MSYLQFAEYIRKATVKRYVFTINNVLAALGSKLALYRCRSSDTVSTMTFLLFWSQAGFKGDKWNKTGQYWKNELFHKHCYMGSCDFLDFGDFDQYVSVNPILTVII